MKKSCAICLIFIFHFSFFILSFSWADTVYTESGDAIKGLIVEQHHDRIVISTYRGEEIMPKGLIQQIFFDMPEQNYMYLGDIAFEEGDLNMALGFYYKANQMNPDSKEAKDAILKAMDEQNREELGLSNATTLLYKQLGLKLKKKGDKIEVVFVKEDSTADLAGIKKGDFIDKVWNASVRYMKPQKAARLIMGKPGTAVGLSIQRNIELPVMRDTWLKRVIRAVRGRNIGDVGITLSMEEQGLTAAEIIKNSPAEKRGLREDDLIYEIDYESTRYMPLAHAANLIFYAKAKKVDLSISRELILLRKGGNRNGR